MKVKIGLSPVRSGFLFQSRKIEARAGAHLFPIIGFCSNYISETQSKGYVKFGLSLKAFQTLFKTFQKLFGN